MAGKSEASTLSDQILAVIAEVVGKKLDKVEPEVFDIPSFCERHLISKSTYFNLRNAGLGPRVMRVGGRVLISKEAAAEWRKAREAPSGGEAA